MIRLGEYQTLTVEKLTAHGAFLVDPADPEGGDVLLPGNQVPEDTAKGEPLPVFIYRDSKDRLIATMKRPKLTLHEVGRLRVVSVSRIGAFLDWGLDKDLFLPFREQPRDARVREGDVVLAAVYTDKSDRLCATMNVYPYLESAGPYAEGDTVEGTVYETSDNFGAFVAVDDRYSALIPKQEAVRKLTPGEKVTARVAKVLPDGRLNLSLRAKVAEQMETDADVLIAYLEKNGGVIPFTDKASPELIRSAVGMSKAQFKRAVGRLYKEREIRIEADRIVRTEEDR